MHTRTAGPLRRGDSLLPPPRGTLRRTLAIGRGAAAAAAEPALPTRACVYDTIILLLRMIYIYGRGVRPTPARVCGNSSEKRI